jgi:hypothetical protein
LDSACPVKGAHDLLQSPISNLQLPISLLLPPHPPAQAFGDFLHLVVDTPDEQR